MVRTGPTLDTLVCYIALTEWPSLGIRKPLCLYRQQRKCGILFGFPRHKFGYTSPIYPMRSIPFCIGVHILFLLWQDHHTSQLMVDILLS